MAAEAAIGARQAVLHQVVQVAASLDLEPEAQLRVRLLQEELLLGLQLPITMGSVARAAIQSTLMQASM